MRRRRTHETMSDDGVTIRATVTGKGPSLVFLQGVIGDGDLDWSALVPQLADHFTCHLPSMRGRGRSDAHPNVRIDRVGQDYATYVESLGEAVGLVGWSAGAGHALSLASRVGAVDATACYEPMVGVLMDEEERADLRRALTRGRELTQEEDLTAAMRTVAAHPFTTEDLAAAERAGYLEAAAHYAPHLLQVFQQVPEHDGPMPEDPEVLGAISSPLLVLLGSETKPLFSKGASHVVASVAGARARVIPGAGHAGPLTHPLEVASELTGFFLDVASLG